MNEKWRKRDEAEALSTLTQIKAALVLITNNDLACEIHIAGMKIGLSDNMTIKSALQAEAAEIRKYLQKKPNKYE